ncbi:MULTISPECIES: hypothetical protein [unclassified Allobranchiibius]|uniref:hypothetical protein n=1 Tax=unclassified Allobranchiibius TaxID=2649857 RepID=UPI001AA13B3B|nr:MULTISPECIES: hypothetical protein [unclassified Allobranchiibius]MBO1767931.1 hypothetical protein [Allobranchiibius sp. GilTou38]UIJ36239.1 hypothetical protein LVQ62_07685 [Allobranchiibius sp. GilTou73]
MTRARFHGTITGIGTTSGVRVVVGQWRDTPYGSFDDVMLQTSEGHRRLLAPTAQVAEFIEQTYEFDEVSITPVTVVTDGETVRLTADDLSIAWAVGRRTAIGRLLRAVPARLATAPAWSRLIDPVARVVMRGVRTAGTARAGRREFYGARDMHELVRVSGEYAGRDLGELAPVSPAVSFGFGSAPARPAVTTIVTTVIERSAKAQPQTQ